MLTKEWTSEQEIMSKKAIAKKKTFRKKEFYVLEWTGTEEETGEVFYFIGMDMDNQEEGIEMCIRDSTNTAWNQ